MKQKILITGVGGYVGGRILDYLLRMTSCDFHVITRKPELFQKIHRVYAFRYCDVNSTELRKALNNVDTVIHLAALNEKQCLNSPIEAINVNFSDSVRLLEASMELGVKRFVYFSTAHVYGRNMQGKVSELTCPRPDSIYAISHLAFENYLISEAIKSKIEGVSLRLSNGVGAPVNPSIDRWSLLVNDLCRNVVKDRIIVLQSDGSAVRDYIPLLDVCRATAHMLGLDLKKFDSDKIFNLGTGISHSVHQVATLIAERVESLWGWKPSVASTCPLNYVSKSEVELRFTYNVSKLYGTGFEPKSTLAEAIDETLEFCKEHF
jgi:UDP-glucose 4-epimerase